MAVELDTRGSSISAGLQALELSARQTFLLGVFLEMLDNGQLVKLSSDGAEFEGVDLTEEVPADPDDVAAGVDTILANTIASTQFWRLQQTVSIADSSPFNIRLRGASLTPGTTNHTMNILMSDVNAAVTWQIQDIAAGLKGTEGKITFVNTNSNARNCFPQNHAVSGASVRYADGISQSDLVLPANSGSRLNVYFEIITDGPTGVFEIVGVKQYTA